MSTPTPPNGTAVERIPGFLYTVRLTPDGKYTVTAPPAEMARLCEISPAEVSEMLTAGRLPFLPDRDNPEFWESIRASAEHLTPWVEDVRVVGPQTGRERWVRVHGIPHREPDGTVEWTGLALDVTDLKVAEIKRREAVKALARNEAWMRAALSGAKMLGWELDLVTNKWATTVDIPDFYGVPRGLDYTDPEVSLTAVHPDDVPIVRAGRQRAIETGEPMYYEFRGSVPAADGLPRWFTTRGQVSRDESGKPVRLVAVTSDITERKRGEAERAALDSQLLEAQKWESLGVLAGGVAHDFNNILTVVLGSAGLARRTLPAPSPAIGYLDQIEQACRRAADLCRQLLAYAGRGHLATGTTDLNQLIRSSAALLGVPTSKSARIQFNLAEDLPYVRGDAAQVRQVLVNLVMNAAEAVGEAEGDVVIETRAVEILAGSTTSYHLPPTAGWHVRLAVTDTGPGITPEVRVRMFDPFFTTKFAGRGLGLSAVLGIMRAHGGAIRVTTASGCGTTVEALWPGAATATMPAAPAVSTPPAPPARGSAGKALVVDDEMYVREVTASTLEELGYEPLLAGDGPSALELFRKYHDEVRVAVIDVVMPGMNGDQLLDALRAIEPALTVVLVSGFTDRRVIGSIGTHTEFLQKPFHPEELLALVKRMVAG